MANRDRAARVATYVTAEDEVKPNLCAACLGPTTHVRLVRNPKGKRCHVCDRPYASFQWRVSGDARPRTTLVCHSCSQDKNCCQSCLHDLATGLSMDRRAQMTAEQIATLLEKKRSRTTEEENAALMANQVQLQSRFGAKRCAFFAQGTCTRGAACPYRHVVEPRREGQATAAAAPAAAPSPTPAKVNAAKSIRERYASAVSNAVSSPEPPAADRGHQALLLMASRAPAAAGVSDAAAAVAADPPGTLDVGRATPNAHGTSVNATLQPAPVAGSMVVAPTTTATRTDADPVAKAPAAKDDDEPDAPAFDFSFLDV